MAILDGFFIHFLLNFLLEIYVGFQKGIHLRHIWTLLALLAQVGYVRDTHIRKMYLEGGVPPYFKYSFLHNPFIKNVFEGGGHLSLRNGYLKPHKCLKSYDILVFVISFVSFCIPCSFIASSPTY